MDKLPKDMMEAVDGANLDEATKKLITRILFAERTKKEQQWNCDAVEMLDKYLLTEQGGQDALNF